MIDRVEQRFGLKPDRLVGDTAYGTAPMLGWMVQDKRIEPHVPVWDKTERKDGTLSSSEFAWNEQSNEYRCPQGHALRSDRRQFTRPREHVTQADTVIYRASQHDCTGCSMKQQCCPNTPARKIARSVHERSRDVAREIATTPQYRQSRRERKKVEILFAHLKRILRLDRLRLRGLTGAHDESLLAATAQNLRRIDEWPSGCSKGNEARSQSRPDEAAGDYDSSRTDSRAVLLLLRQARLTHRTPANRVLQRNRPIGYLRDCPLIQRPPIAQPPSPARTPAPGSKTPVCRAGCRCPGRPAPSRLDPARSSRRVHLAASPNR
jgi:Transposase DDE domain